MNYKYIITISIFFYCFISSTIGCGCEVEGPFLKLAPSAKLIAVVKVKQYLSFEELEGIEVPMSMEMEVVKVLKGTETRPFIKVWGNNGMMCRPYLSLFEENSTWVMAFGEDGALGHDGASTEDYGVSHCGEQFMPVKMGTVSGFIGSEQFEQISIGALQAKLDILNREEGLIDYQKCQFVQQLFWQDIDTIGVFESNYIGHEPKKFQLKTNGLMVADDAYPDFYDFIQKVGVTRQLFIFWQKDGRHFVKQIDNCIEHAIIEIEGTHFFSVYFQFNKWMKKEVPRLPKLSETKRQIKQKQMPLKLMADSDTKGVGDYSLAHTKHAVQMILKDRVYLREYDMRLFDKQYNKTYYKKNQKLLSYGWLELLQEETAWITQQNQKSRHLFKQYKKLVAIVF